MTAGPLITTPLTPEHASQLDALLTTLSPEEALWISGYLAGFARQAPAPAVSAAMPALTILHGSETGHAAELAGRMGELARERGLMARVVDMADFRPQGLKEVRHLVVLVSTYGDGDPPDRAAGFHEFLHSRKAPRLEGTKFAVLGLGDSTYERFCQTGKDFDHRLELLGAERIHPRADCDVDYDEQASAWIDATLAAFARELRGAAAIAPAVGAPAVGADILRQPVATRFDRQSPFLAPIVETLVLNGRGSDKETRHIELSLEGSGLTYQPGDALGIVPENDPAAVSDLIQALDLDPEEPVPAGSSDLPLAVALARHYEITTLTPRFLERYAEAARDDTLRALATPENGAEFRAWLAGRQIIDVVSEFPVKRLGGRSFVAMLRKLQPRLYSLASSQAAFPGEAHITVAVVRYRSHGRGRKGVASAWVAERRGLDDTVPVYVAANANFRLPADGATPIIMIGAGTGIAPFRAFLQDREAAGACGRNWLFFGDRRFRTDFLYQVEWQRLLKDGRLTRMEVAFSRDQDDKVYVQHRLLERAREVYSWLEDGAHVYVCGDAGRLAPDVHAALTAIVEREGRMGRDHAEEYVKRLQREKRYQRDVY